jgi:hypothetical protein
VALAVRRSLALWLPAFLLAAPGAQEALPTARLVPAPQLVMPGAVDSSVPITWDLVTGEWKLFAFTSWGGVPALVTGPALDRLQRVGAVSVVPHPGHGIWIDSVLVDEIGVWYAYYHHEVLADMCGSTTRAIPKIAAAKSADRGLTWEDLGPILEAPPDTFACASLNRYVVGGVGDVSAVLDHERQDVFLFFSEYSKHPAEQGVAVARLAWADRETPMGRVTIWQNGVWLSPRRVADGDAESNPRWEYPAGTPLVPVSRPWHDGNASADAFWGPSVHWNTYLGRYVMLLNRARDEGFGNEGIYVSYAGRLDEPPAWSAPRKIMNGGGWYPQVAGLEPGSGTDKLAAQRARFFVTGRSEHYIEFHR